MIVALNVGGTRFTTSMTTLQSEDSFLSSLVSGALPSTKDETGAFFIDRDPVAFATILNYMREPDKRAFSLPSGQQERAQLAREADFYCLEGLKALLAGRSGMGGNGGLATATIRQTLGDRYVFRPLMDIGDAYGSAGWMKDRAWETVTGKTMDEIIAVLAKNHGQFVANYTHLMPVLVDNGYGGKERSGNDQPTCDLLEGLVEAKEHRTLFHEAQLDMAHLVIRFMQTTGIDIVGIVKTSYCITLSVSR